MLKRLAAVTVSILVLVLGVPGIALADWGDGDAFDVLNGQPASDQVWESLCVGASLDLSTASAASCVRQRRVANATREPAGPPNIGAGLCVGASLDLSAASGAKCVAMTKKKRPPAQPPNIGQGLCVGASLDLSAASGAKCAKQQACADTCTTHKQTLPKTGDEEIAPQKEPSTLPKRPASQYAALGDSVAAGAGLSSPAGGDKRCDQTFEAYVYQVADMRGLEINNLACAGATMGDLFTEQVLPGANIPPQLDGAFANGTPELITITAGANDVRWSDFLRECFASTCGTAADDTAMNGLLEALRVKTKHALKSIDGRSSGSPPDVIMTGYYHALSDRCAEIEPRLTLQEIEWLNLQTDRLNRTLERAASHSDFAEFVPIASEFEGHDICSIKPWVQGLDDAAPFHPTADGQRAIAEAVN